MHIYNEWGRKYRRGKVEIIETVIDGNKFLKGPSLPGKGLQTQNESLTLDRRRDIAFTQEGGGGEDRYMRMQVSLKGTREGVVWMAWMSLWEKKRVHLMRQGVCKEGRSLEEWLESGRKLLGTNSFPNSQEALAFIIGSAWGRRVEHSEKRMLFIMVKKGSYKVTDWETVDWRSLLGMQWE